jgi:hypothetical protein
MLEVFYSPEKSAVQRKRSFSAIPRLGDIQVTNSLPELQWELTYWKPYEKYIPFVPSKVHTTS